MEQIKLPFPGKPLWEQEDEILLASLIFLKARDDIHQARIGIGCVVRNRVSNPRWWGKTYKDVIIPLLNINKITDEEKDLVSYPIRNNINEKWDACYVISKGIITNLIPDITFNSDFYFLKTEKLPHWITSRKDKGKCWYVSTFGNILLYRVELKEKLAT